LTVQQNLFCCVLLALSQAAQSADILSIEVDNDEGTYTLTSEVWFDATLPQVFEVYRYWEYWTRFSSAIVEARDLPADEQGRPLFYIRYKGCVLFFCPSFERQGYIETEVNKELRAFADPKTSDFHHSIESWRFVARDGGTVVTYDMSMAPKFWIPPGIGPYLIKRKLKKNGGEAVNRIEVVAREMVPRGQQGE
jgi:hypothetical protein